MTWTVTAGAITTNRYTLIGKTLTWTLYIGGATTLGGSAANFLYLTIPGGYLANVQAAVPAGRVYDGTGWHVVACLLNAASATATLGIFDGSNFALGSGYVQVTMTFEIQ
jgi:hypothetical protein